MVIHVIIGTYCGVVEDVIVREDEEGAEQARLALCKVYDVDPDNTDGEGENLVQVFICNTPEDYPAPRR